MAPHFFPLPPSDRVRPTVLEMIGHFPSMTDQQIADKITRARDITVTAEQVAEVRATP